MRYIRFLKTPKLQDGSIKATITVTSDLGETFLDEELQLAATLRSADLSGDIYLRKTLRWRSGLRTLSMSFSASDNDIDWPCRVHVAVKNSPDSDHFGNNHGASALPSIISAWSDVLDPSKGINTASRTIERRFKPLNSRILGMWEETGESIARHLWDGGIALTAYVDRMIDLQGERLPPLEDSISSPTSKKLNVIELGCGCGMVGIGLAQIVPDCSVLLTDMPEAQEIASRNIANMNPAMSSQATFMPLDWESPLPKTIESRIFDVVIVSECTYNTNTIPALVRTLSALNKRSPKAVVLVSTKVRHSSESMFFELMEESEFVKASHNKLPLPKDESSNEDPEVVHVYIFHNKNIPLKVLASENEGNPLVRFWPL